VRRPLLALLLASAVLPRARAEEDRPPARGDVASLRFAWPDDARARVSYRRTRRRTGERPEVFTARYETVAERGPAGFRVSTRGTSWKGDLPVPPALAPEAVRASEAVVQRIRPQGEFQALDGVEAMRPVLARVLDEARVPPDQAERALAQALAATRAEAEELWNLAVGFWTGADLRVGEKYAMQSEAELPLLSGVRATQAVEFGVRRRVPCAAPERAPRCVEVVLRSTPDRAALEAAAPALLARLLPDSERRGSRMRLPRSEGGPASHSDAVRESWGARAPSEQEAPRLDVAKELTAERTLVLVTEPGTLLPRRMVWSKAVRLGGGEGGPPAAEQVDRSEWDWRWAPPAPPPKPKKRTPAPAALGKPSPPA
jgi:hypothetical protein